MKITKWILKSKCYKDMECFLLQNSVDKNFVKFKVFDPALLVNNKTQGNPYLTSLALNFL